MCENQGKQFKCLQILNKRDFSIVWTSYIDKYPHPLVNPNPH